MLLRKTQRLTLREWQPGDAARLIEIAGQPHIENWLPDWREYDKHAAGWINMVRRHYTTNDPMEAFISWAIVLGDRLIGQIGIGSFAENGKKEIGIGYFMDEQHLGCGYTTEAVQEIVSYAFATYGFDHMIATVQPDNLPSNAVVKKAGFQFIEVIRFKDTDQPEVLPFNYYCIENENPHPVIIDLREHPHFIDRAANFFSERWQIDRALYIESMQKSFVTENAYPRWYLMLENAEIVGGCGLIENDFMVHDDLRPWLCGLYVEARARGAQRGALLLERARKGAGEAGLEKLYLNTSHVGYYERYGWRYIGDFDHQDGEKARVYEAETLA